MPGRRLFLASQSPRRLQLLQQLGFDPARIDVQVPERRLPGEPALDYVSRVAREKAGAGLLALGSRPDAVVLGADTEVVLDEDVFGKPADAAEAAAMLRRLAGRCHRAVSVVWAVDAARELHATCVTEVRFGELHDATIATYLASGEWQGKAGAYAIQGRAGAFVARIEGSFTGVMGLPLYETAGLLRQFGLT